MQRQSEFHHQFCKRKVQTIVSREKETLEHQHFIIEVLNEETNAYMLIAGVNKKKVDICLNLIMHRFVVWIPFLFILIYFSCDITNTYEAKFDARLEIRKLNFSPQRVIDEWSNPPTNTYTSHTDRFDKKLAF